MTHKLKIHCLSAILLVALVGGCQGKTNTDPDAATSPNRQSPKGAKAPQAGSTRYGALAAAAEPFEALTEQAFSADQPRLAKLLAAVEAAASDVRPLLAVPAARRLDARLADAKAGISGHKPVDTAIAAVEGYRLIVSEFPVSAKIPPAVSLLDYAGFRIQANAKADPVRWADAQAALDFANRQWASVAGKVADKELRLKFQRSLGQLGEAIKAKDAATVSKYVALELDLVDNLESYFDPA